MRKPVWALSTAELKEEFLRISRQFDDHVKAQRASRRNAERRKQSLKVAANDNKTECGR